MIPLRRQANGSGGSRPAVKARPGGLRSVERDADELRRRVAHRGLLKCGVLREVPGDARSGRRGHEEQQAIGLGDEPAEVEQLALRREPRREARLARRETADVLGELPLEEGRAIRPFDHDDPGADPVSESVPRGGIVLGEQACPGYFLSWTNWARTRTLGESAASSVRMRIESR